MVYFANTLCLFCGSPWNHRAIYLEKQNTLSVSQHKKMTGFNFIKLPFNLIQKGLRHKPLNSSTEIRLTRLCTQHCRQCNIHARTTDPPTMNWKTFQQINQRLKDYGSYIGFISGGEATLVPHLDKVLMEAKKTFTLSTTLVTGLVNQFETIKRIGKIALDHDIHIQTSLDGLGELGDHLRGVNHFSDTALKHMEWISENRGNSKSLLYANIVINNLNLDQVPQLIRRTNDIGWKTTIGLYHTLTQTTRYDERLRLRSGKRLDRLLEHLQNNPGILNLDTYIKGISSYVNGNAIGCCAFVDAPVLATRTTIMENGDVHLCYGEPIGNLFEKSLKSIFNGQDYAERLQNYRSCKGCWTTCYTQRFLLAHPRSFKEFFHNLKKVCTLRK